MIMKKRWRKIEYDLINKQQAIKEAVNNWKLSKRMLSVLGLAVTVFCITMIALLVFFRHRMKAQVLDYSDNTVYLMSVSTDQLMKNIEESTIQIISMPAIIEFLQQEDMDEVTLYHSKKNLEENYMNPILGAMRFVQSIEIQSEKRGETYSFGNNRSGDRALYKQNYGDSYNKKQKWFWFEDNYHNKDEISIVYRRDIYEFSTKQKLGTIYVEVSDKDISDRLLYEFNYIENSEIQLVDNYGNVIVGDGKFFDNATMADVYKNTIVSEEKEKAVTRKIGKEKYILDYSKLSNDWMVVHIIPCIEIFSAIDKMLVIVMGIWGLVTAGIVFSTFTIARSITRPIELLEKTMEEVKRGDFSKSVPVISGGEIGRLCNGFNIMIQKINSLFHEFEIKQREKKEAELRSLQNQISPHFLCNILNSLACDARLRGNEDYALILNDLIQLLRKSLNYKCDYITVEEEISLLENYLHLQQFRYRNKFDYSVMIDEEAKKCCSLKLILQPIAENCILHGMGKNFMRIRVTAEKRNSEIWISIQDDGEGMEKERLLQIQKELEAGFENTEKHIGLGNVNKRIRLYFGEAYGVIVTSGNHFTKVDVHFPAVLEDRK